MPAKSTFVTANPTPSTTSTRFIDPNGLDPLVGLAAAINAAKQCHFTAKRNAVEAAARAYMVWCIAFSPAANPDFKKYVENEISKRNAEIESHNDDVDSDKADATKLAKGKLPKKHQLMSEPTTEEERQENEAEKNRLMQLYKTRSADDWKAAKKIRIEPIKDAKGAQRFTECIRYVFDFVSPEESSLVSRYAQALQWINEKFGMQATREAPNTIADSLVDFGGLEAAIRHQREKTKAESGSPNSRRQSAQETKLAKLKEAADLSDALATVDINLDVAPGLVVILGRYKDGELELIQTLQVSDAEFDKLLLRYGQSANDQ